MGRYNKEHGFEADCDVIYGDTDSVMVNFKVADIGRAMELGREAADFVSQTFVKPIKLEFEKVRWCCECSCCAQQGTRAWINHQQVLRNGVSGKASSSSSFG